MRVLLDESLPRRLARHLASIDADSVFDRGWSGLKNGALLELAEKEYDAFLTADQTCRTNSTCPASISEWLCWPPRPIVSRISSP